MEQWSNGAMEQWSNLEAEPLSGPPALLPPSR